MQDNALNLKTIEMAPWNGQYISIKFTPCFLEGLAEGKQNRIIVFISKHLKFSLKYMKSIRLNVLPSTNDFDPAT